ncbi:MAG: DegV family protein [Clostridiales bacterium]|nr:DegV family protein [Clostridiales bacterium]
MREYIFATESNADLSESYINENNVLVIPHYYLLDEKLYGEDEFLSNKEFYDGMREGKKAGTMASNPAVILEKFTEVAKQGKDILFISFSSALSSGIQNIINGANEVMEEYPEMKIIVIDSFSATSNEKLLIKKGLMLKKEGKSIEEAARILEGLVPHLCGVFTVDSLEYLYRGGRVSKTSAVLGTMINIKPVLIINEEGKLIPISKVRGRKKSIKYLIDYMKERIGSYIDKQILVGVIHADVIEDANALVEMLKEEFPDAELPVEILDLGPSIGAHSGPGTLGLMFLGETR